MSEPPAPLEEKVTLLEQELDSVKKQMLRLYEKLMGSIAILCLPMSASRRTEIGFALLKELPDGILKVIVRTYVEEGKKSDLGFDEIINPIVRTLGLARAWKIVERESIRGQFGEWDLNKWEEMAKDHPCEK